MSKKERAGLSGRQTTFLVILCLLTAWEILKNDRLTNEIAALLFGGVVPGTNKVLAPQTMMYVAGGVAVLVALLVTVHFVRRAGRRREHDEQTTNSGVAALASTMGEEADRTPKTLESVVSDDRDSYKAATPKLVVNVELDPISAAFVEPEKFAKQATEPARQRAAVFTPFFALAAKALQRLLKATGIHGTKVGRALSLAARRAALGARIASRVVAHAAAVTYVFMVKTTAAASKHVVRVSVALRRWLTPYLWQFDGWLELRVRDIEKWGRKKARKHEDAMLFFDITRKSVKLLDRKAERLVKKVSASLKTSRKDQELEQD